MSEINWKAKYMKLRSTLMESVDTAYRVGCEDGMKMAQEQQVQEAQAQQQQAEAAAQTGGQAPGEDGQAGPAAPGAAPGGESENPQGSELDQHLAKLEEMIAKSEKTEADLEVMAKATHAIKSIRLDMKSKEADRLAKAQIDSIAKSLNRKPGTSVSTKDLLKPDAKAALSMQERTIQEMMKTWSEEEDRAKNDILSVLSNEGIVKRD